MSVAEHNQAWAACLADHFPRTVVASPGSRNTPLVLAFAAKPGADIHCILDERAAGFFALGLARAKGEAVVLVCTSGSAGAHYLPAVIEADLSGIPLVILTADRPPELQHCGAAQTIDQTRLFGTHARWFADIGTPHGDTSARWLRSIAAQALDQAEGAMPGPVHLNVPFREPLWHPELQKATPSTPPLRTVRGIRRLGSESLQDLAARLTQHPRGVIVAGGMLPATPLREAVGALAERLGWPILPETTSQLRAHTTAALQAHVVTAYDALLRDPGFADAHAPTLALRFGQASTSKIIGSWLAKHCTDSTILIHSEGRLTDPHRSADTLVVADPATLIADLLPHLPKPQPGPVSWLKAWQAAEKSARHALDTACSEGFWEAAVAREVHARLPEGGVLHVASSMPIRDLDSFAPAKNVTVYANRGANGIDGTVASALGAAAAHPGRPTVLLTGDLAFLHDLGAVQLARQLDVSLTIVVVNNGGGGIFEFLPIAQHPDHFTRLFRTPQKASLQALAQAAGAHARQVQSTQALSAALEAARPRPGLTVIEAVMPPDTQNVTRHRAAWAAVAAFYAQRCTG